MFFSISDYTLVGISLRGSIRFDQPVIVSPLFGELGSSLGIFTGSRSLNGPPPPLRFRARYPISLQALLVKYVSLHAHFVTFSAYLQLLVLWIASSPGRTATGFGRCFRVVLVFQIAERCGASPRVEDAEGCRRGSALSIGVAGSVSEDSLYWAGSKLNFQIT